MAGDTYITVVGNLTADPEVRTTSNGGTVVNLTIASTPRQYDRNTNQWEDGETLYLRCSVWDTQYHPTASNIQSSLAKGMRVIAQGRLVQRSYQDREGNNRTVVELRLDEIGPALTRNTAQVTRNGNSQQHPSQQSQQWGSGPQQWGGQQAQAPASQPQDPWGGAGNDDQVF
ncbi:single-stranded DNA-binding protein [Bifidobacterium sp. W8113]|uniref:single-stranded DNA-binding protein n=1 Tax=Bifidobacterium choladohabitans TaxID=2750947 RepID=UPI0018DCF4B1|nr:single-stranded DNA-binding protein [Bifidobacterium choladohabitans]MBI0089176.1 single-stranded DNA-binding protein [Bifidobacterium choladohabitans]